jgi:uncharacterized membrane protein YjjP (DUF1212 family)
MKKLIFEFIAFAFCFWLLCLVGSQRMSTNNNLVFPFALFLLASGITFCNVVASAYKLLSK